DRRNRGRAWEKSKDQPSARATWRYAVDLRRYFEGEKIAWLYSAHAVEQWPAAFHRLVSGPSEINMSTLQLPFDQRACFIAGQAKSGTTLLVALLDNHPELLVLPEETAYFPTVLTKYAPRGRRAQFDYLTKQSLSNVLFGGPCKWRKRKYATCPRAKFLETFKGAAFDPANTQEDLLVLMVKAYAATLERPLETVSRWVEKTPANRNHIPAILTRFPRAKILVTVRDPRAILAAQIALEKTRKTGRFSTYYVIAHWRVAARLAMRVRDGEI